MPKKLALLGGRPIRTRPFSPSGATDREEISAVMEVFRRGEFSRYSGGGLPDLERVLALKSAAAVSHPLPYWNFLGGEVVRRFEADFAAAFGMDYAVAVNSATSGLSVALAAADIGPGDEVITPALTFTATTTSILLFNSIPVFADVDPRSCCLDPGQVEAAVTKRTKAILVVHLLGNTADMDRINAIARKHRLVVIEDVAQAPGSKYKGRWAGSHSDASVFSFQETKNMMTGEGGMILTNKPALARKCRLIRNHGEFAMASDQPLDELVNVVGCNFRMTELTAAVGVAQLKKLKSRNDWRNDNAAYLEERLSKLPWLRFNPAPKHCERVVHLSSMDYDEKAAGVPKRVMVTALQKEGIPVSGGYPRLTYHNPLFQKRIAFGRNGCPFTCGLEAGEAPRRYPRGLNPVAEELIAKKHIWFYHINFPNNHEDMDDAARAFFKVHENLGDLMKLDERSLVTAYGR